MTCGDGDTFAAVDAASTLSEGGLIDVISATFNACLEPTSSCAN
jgi:hypothetical protein